MIVRVPTPIPKSLRELIRPFDFENSVFVMLTDTIYGIHTPYASAAGRDRIATLKNRANSAFIVLVNGLPMARELCEINSLQEKILIQYWPGSISFVLPSKDGSGTLALRHANVALVDSVLADSGALLSTSANRTGESPSATAADAQNIFGNSIDFYLESGRSPNTVPSTLVDLSADAPKVLREGAVAFHPPTPVAQS